jgi:hypothetical protein
LLFLGVVYLDPPPPPPRQVIKHICQRPPKPRDIIIERWLPYKFLPPRRFFVERATPPVTPSLHNVNIIHEPQAVNIEHQIEVLPSIQTDPEAYRQQHGNTLLREQELNNRLFATLRAQRADEDIVSHSVRYMYTGK